MFGEVSSSNILYCNTWWLLVVLLLFIRHSEKMLSDSEAAELLSFLTPSTRADVKGRATEYILGLSGHR